MSGGRLMMLPCVHFGRILLVRLHGSPWVMVKSTSVHVGIGGRIVACSRHLSLILLHHCGVMRVVSSVRVMPMVHARRWDPWWHLSVGHLRSLVVMTTILQAIVVRVLHTIASVVRILHCLALLIRSLPGKLTLCSSCSTWLA